LLELVDRELGFIIGHIQVRILCVSNGDVWVVLGPCWLPVQALLGTASTGAVPAVFVLIFKGEGDFS